MHSIPMRLWISNIPYYWSAIELEKIFSVCLFYLYIFFKNDTQAFGQVYDVEIPLKNGQSRGYGFVTFEKYDYYMKNKLRNTYFLFIVDNLMLFEQFNRWMDK